MAELVQSKLKAQTSGETWSVIVLYEDKPTRDRAMALCDRLVKNFWSEVEFDIRWWRTDFLIDPRMAQTAAADAVAADIFILCSAPAAELSPIFVNWLEGWMGQREAREGMFLDLSDAESQASQIGQRKQARLREIVARGSLEYFNRIPPPLGGVAASSWQNNEDRAKEVTSTLDAILNHVPPPTHFGLNE